MLICAVQGWCEPNGMQRRRETAIGCSFSLYRGGVSPTECSADERRPSGAQLRTPDEGPAPGHAAASQLLRSRRRSHPSVGGGVRTVRTLQPRPRVA